MEILNNEADISGSENRTYEKIDRFQYIGVILSAKNDCSRETGLRTAKTERVSFALGI